MSQEESAHEVRGRELEQEYRRTTLESTGLWDIYGDLGAGRGRQEMNTEHDFGNYGDMGIWEQSMGGRKRAQSTKVWEGDDPGKGDYKRNLVQSFVYAY